MQNAENILFTITMIGYFAAMALYFLFVSCFFIQHYVFA